MTAVGKYRRGSGARVEELLRTQEAAPWADAPAGMRERVLTALPARMDVEAERGRRGVSWGWALAACGALLGAGGGAYVGMVALRDGAQARIGSPDLLANDTRRGGDAAGTSIQPADVLARAFDDLTPAGSARIMEVVSLPMRTEVEGLAAETRLAARSVLGRLPFVAME